MIIRILKFIGAAAGDSSGYVKKKSEKFAEFRVKS